ncbi:MAG: hypothetical protein KDK60_00955 [Chlamydiia bacterium]|nr:hypothetical protein [Chlamydiia bacterium]
MKWLLTFGWGLCLLSYGALFGVESVLRVHLPMDIVMDRDRQLVAEFLLFTAEANIDDSEKQLCHYTFRKDGVVTLSGPEEVLKGYAKALGQRFERVALSDMESTLFDQAKVKFLHHLSVGERLHEMALASELTQQHLKSARDGLVPLQLVLQKRIDLHESEGKLALASSSPNYECFYNLSLSEEDRSNISKLIKNMGDSNWWELLNQKKKMEKIGDKLYHVHPLRFIGYILSDPTLKKKMGKIMGDIVKRKSFLTGFGKRIGFVQKMSKEAEKDNLFQYISGFSQSIGVSEEEIISYFHAHDWEGLIKALI